MKLRSVGQQSENVYRNEKKHHLYVHFGMGTYLFSMIMSFKILVNFFLIQQCYSKTLFAVHTLEY